MFIACSLDRPLDRYAFRISFACAAAVPTAVPSGSASRLRQSKLGQMICPHNQERSLRKGLFIKSRLFSTARLSSSSSKCKYWRFSEWRPFTLKYNRTRAHDQEGLLHPTIMVQRCDVPCLQSSRKVKGLECNYLGACGSSHRLSK